MFYKKSDIKIILAIIAVSITSWLSYKLVFSEVTGTAEIYYDSQLVKTVELNKKEEMTFSIQQNEYVVFHIYKDGSICFENSNCPDKICIHSGRLKNIGEYAACLPNRIVLKIVEKGD